MRFKNTINIRPNLGDTKIKYIFLIFPKTINNETRWLEYANIKYMYKFKRNCLGDIITGWDVMEWINK